jgi:hypothetical protein
MSGTRGPSGLEWLIVAAAVLAAHGFYLRILWYPSEFDAKNYLDIATDIAKQGLFAQYYYSQIRTYGYPLLLAGLLSVSRLTGASWVWLVFESQLALYLAAAWMVRQSIRLFAPSLARIVFIGLAANVLPLSYTAETLTESVSASLLLGVCASWLRLWQSSGRGRWVWLVTGSLLAGFAVMVRPANLFLAAAWLLAAGALVWARFDSSVRRAGACAVMAICLLAPMLPQYANNVRHYDKPTPLVASTLALYQQYVGVEHLKYATGLPPVPTPSVYYNNPFAQGRPIDGAKPLRWYVDHPLQGALTLGLHVFNMLDQDLLFTYSRDLDPWYRLPLALFTHGGLALAFMAWLLFTRTAWQASLPPLQGEGLRNERHREFDRRLPWLALTVLASLHIGLHAVTLVEMRFGLPLLVLAGPMAAWMLVHMTTSEPARTRRFRVMAVTVWVVVALLLSHWVRQQAPSIRAWDAAKSASSSTSSPGTRAAP